MSAYYWFAVPCRKPYRHLVFELHCPFEATVMDRNQLNERLPLIVDSLVQDIANEPALQHLDRVLLPNRDAIVQAIDTLRQLIFPGYFGKQTLNRTNVRFRLGELVIELCEVLFDQVRCCLLYRKGLPVNGDQGQCASCDEQAAQIVADFFDNLPRIRKVLATDVRAAFEGDPAASSTDETIFCYPGLVAITVQRVAHEFYLAGVPMMPRIMTEYAHSLTGIDIHPGAALGPSFFIDHGTGVVIGETTLIGTNVKVYQGVTLGALAPAAGQKLRGLKRHPTIEDDVTIYAGATILGGDTIIGKGSVIGGNVFVTSSVPPMNLITAESPRLTYKPRRARGDNSSPFISDFVI